MERFHFLLQTLSEEFLLHCCPVRVSKACLLEGGRFPEQRMLTLGRRKTSRMRNLGLGKTTKFGSAAKASRVVKKNKEKQM